MFGIFKKRQPVEPPTEKQRKYAARLGIEVTTKMSKSDLSQAIAVAEHRNPKAAAQRQRVTTKARERQFGQALIDQESHWSRFAEDVEYMLAIYKRGANTLVDVLRVNEAYITDKGALKLGVETPKLVKDRLIGEHLEWDKYFELLISALLHHEPLRKQWYDSHGGSFARANLEYKKLVEKGLETARKMC